MKINRKNLLFLTGGLGNQLFQLAYAMASSADGFTIEKTKGKPRLSNNSEPDSFDFRWPDGLTSEKAKKGELVGRILGYNLRLGVVPKGVERRSWYLRVVRFVSSVLISFHYRRPLFVQVCNGVGFDSLAPISQHNKMIVGYFQSYKWMSEEILMKIQQLELIKPSLSYSITAARMTSEPTLVVHIRQGDYLNEANFGTPNSNYLRAAISEIFQLHGRMRIWGFSDDPEKAKSLLGLAGHVAEYWVPPDELSSSETLELMRMGSAFVLANSTFSWWAAMMRKDLSAPIYCPQPWFKGMDEPRDLVPPSWKRIDAFGS